MARVLVLLRELLSNLARRPATIEYGVRTGPTPSSSYRGLHVVDVEKCIGCSLCAIECPSGAIEMKLLPSQGEGKKPRKYPVVHYDLCMFCYHCVDICPRHAYRVSNRVPPPTPSRGSLVGDPLAGDSGE
ncbi:4Fe-4S binding protein [Pyrodictium abyssi]|uniref:4Fe-4S ferredoxin-type domain-containing protein n=1 Tax=Pyrodictium abyssi TaxID=54256 RepID=A0ABM8IWM8_9CREN|nr:hypothetical protein PABY_15160 [Pyrodictium abyssi]